MIDGKVKHFALESGKIPDTYIERRFMGKHDYIQARWQYDGEGTKRSR
jgi:hypothetical protein